MENATEQDAFDQHLKQWWEGGTEDPTLSAVFGYDDRFPQIDAATIEAALSDFRLAPCNNWNTQLLAVAVRRALASVTPDSNNMPQSYPGNALVRDNIRALADRAAALTRDLEGLGDVESHTIMAALNDEEWHNYLAGLDGLKIIEVTLSSLADAVRIERPKWRSTAAAELRVRQAHCLAPIYEGAFGRQVTVNVGSDSRSLGPWPDFFARMVKLATTETMTHDQLRNTVKEAGRRHRNSPVRFSPAIIPIP